MGVSSCGYTEEEFIEVYKRYTDTIFRLCYIYLKNQADAEDAVQSAFIKLMQSKKYFENEEHEKAWLIVTARNYCKDVLKCFWKVRRTDFEKLPEASYVNEDEGSEVLEKILALPEKYKTVLYLYYYEEYAVKEIAKLLKRNESTVQTQLVTARKKLKMDLEGGRRNEG